MGSQFSIFDYRTDDLEALKFYTEMHSGHLRLSRSAAKKLKNLLLDQNISPFDFKIQVNDIFLTTQTLNYKIRAFFSFKNLFSLFKNIFFQISWPEVFFFTIVLIISYLLYKKFEETKIVLWVTKFTLAFFERSLAATGYLFPFFEVMLAYLPPLVRGNFYFRVVFAGPLKLAYYFYQGVPFMNFIYFFVVYGLYIRNRIGPRFARFHYAYGLMFMNLHQILTQVYHPIVKSYGQRTEKIEDTAYIMFLFITMLLLPNFLNALNGRYTKHPFWRDSVEIILGREFDPNYKWWDRQ